MKAVELKNGIYWVGVIDWAVRDFHGYETPRGTTYNNYLIMDDEITLLDTVKYDFADTMIKNIRSIVDPSKIKHVVINHIENDHVTSIDRIMALTPDAAIYITEKGQKGLERFFDVSGWNLKIVKTGDTLKIGKRTLLFLETPMLHWPDSMMTHIKEDKILISQDGFGQHLASAVRFDDEFAACQSMSELDDAVIDYYANILMPFGQLIKSKIAEVQKLGLEIEMIAPDHGIIWRSTPQKIIRTYLDMANGKANLSVSIIYDTMWHSTEQMTTPMVQGIKDEGVECKVIKLRSTPMSAAIKEFWKSRGCLIGSPTLNNLLYPSVAHFLTQLRGLRPKNRVAGAFGSYGWGGGAVKEAYEEFKKMGLETFEPGLQILYKPSAEDETKCYDFAREFAKKVKEYHQKFQTIKENIMGKSENNLWEAFAGESQANRKYLAFAKKAEEEGYKQIAKLFRAAAEAETVHAHSHLREAGGIKNTKENLEAAISGETHEFQKMYPQMIEDAKAEDNKGAMRTFNFANEVEKIHAELYKKALENIGRNPEADYYVCHVCGNTVENEAPDTCPICGAKKQAFKKME